jgi:hypothetical protein
MARRVRALGFGKSVLGPECRFTAALQTLRAECRLKRLAPDAEFHKDIEAQDFHETLARRQEKVALEEAKKALEFPEEI